VKGLGEPEDPGCDDDSAPPSVGVARNGTSLVAKLLEHVETIAGGRTGEVDVSGTSARIGTIYVEAGEICWAAEVGSGRTLTERLLRRGSLGRSELEDTFRHCQRTGAALGEVLVERGHLTADALRAALREHTWEALLGFAHLAGELTFNARPRSYDPKFRFSACDLLLAAARRFSPETVARATALLACAGGESASGLAFVTELGGERWLAANVGECGYSATDLVALFKLASSMLLLGQRIGPYHEATALLGPNEEATFVWRDGPLLLLARTRSGSASAAMLATLGDLGAPVSQTSPLGLEPSGGAEPVSIRLPAPREQASTPTLVPGRPDRR
jgi:hypothetical protein